MFLVETYPEFLRGKVPFSGARIVQEILWPYVHAYVPTFSHNTNDSAKEGKHCTF